MTVSGRCKRLRKVNIKQTYKKPQNEGESKVLYYSSTKFVTRFAAMNTSAKDDDEG